MLAQVLAEFQAEAPVLAGSAAVGLCMGGFAFAVGFRTQRSLDD